MKTIHQIRQICMDDTIRNNQLILPLIAAFEVFLIVSWYLRADQTQPGAKIYLYLYLSLLLVTVVNFVFIQFFKKDVERHWRKLDIAQHTYSFFLILWAVFITYVGSTMRGSFDYLIYVAIVTIVPMITFMRPILWVAIQVASSAFMFHLAYQHEHFYAFAVNFLIFTLFSIAAGRLLFQTRQSAYMRQIDLEKERNRAHSLAYTDTLTSLPNRHSFSEEFEQLKKHPLPADLIVAVLDVNGLKHANDVYGHDVGDVLIQGAGSCMHKVFGEVGTIYRVGGDEFNGLLHCSEEKFQQLLVQFELLTRYWSEQQGVALSVSVGFASVLSNPNERLATLITKADNAMYDAKQHHYELHPKS